MNYVVLNGTRSDTVKGLLIQSLPPISKPMMRTQIEEIDGRDGDIITKLGYSAYDKVMSIGLHGDYDVDDVIKFFDSEGTVIFSNEPDKYYNYTIINQIDFERLIRFKTAEVTFHVQPFKYSAVRKYALENQYVLIADTVQTQNGVTVEVISGQIHVTGQAVSSAVVNLPMQYVMPEAGVYTMVARATGTNVSGKVRIIGNTPSNADSFGNRSVTLVNNQTVSIQDELNGSQGFKAVYLSFPVGSQMDFYIDVGMLKSDMTSLTVINRGNTNSRPKIKVYGMGNVTINLNGVELFQIALGSFGYILIDSARMNAYQGDVLMNRYVTGDYEKLSLPVGSNTFTWSGQVTGIEVEDFTRWI